MFEEFAAKMFHQVSADILTPVDIMVDQDWGFWKQTLDVWIDHGLVCACAATCCLPIKARACANDDGSRVMFSVATSGLSVFPDLPNRKMSPMF